MPLKSPVVGLLSLVLALIAPSAASAAERYVAPDGDDDSNACLVGADPCATIGHAVGEAEPGDVVRVAAGTYAVSAAVTLDKAVTIAGAQAGVDARERDVPDGAETVIEPASVLGTAVLRLSAPGATVDGVTVRGNDQAAIQTVNSSSGYAVRNTVLTGNEVGVDVETTAVDAQPTVIERNRFDGNNAPSLRSGIYSDHTADAVTIRENRFLGHVNVPINIGGSATSQRDLVISGNTFEDERHLLLLGAERVEVTGNVFVDGRSQAISVEGGVDDLTIAGNAILGTDNAGIIFFDRYGAGPSTAATITGNTIRGTAPGDLAGATGAAIDVSTQWSGNPGYDGPLAVHGNGLVANEGGGVVNDVDGATVDASDNWWGCNAGPGGVGCDTVGGTVEAPTHLVLSATASPADVAIGGGSTVVAALNVNSAGATVAGAPDGTTVSFATVLGALSVQAAPLQSGTAASSFTAGSEVGDAGATVTVDNQTVPVALSVVAPPPVDPPPADPPPADPPPVPAPDEPAPPRPEPPPAPTVRSAKGQPAVSPSGQATVAVVTCDAASACHLRTPKTLKVRIGGKTYKVKVIAPKRVGAGKSARVRIQLSKAARVALAKQRNAKVKVKLTMTGGGERTTNTVNVKIKAKRRR